MLCSGKYNEPIIPTCQGQENFVGKILHSETFRTSDVVEGKQVLVVGGSHSAGDVAVHARKAAKQVYLSTRDGTWLVRRSGPGGVPQDTVLNRLFMLWLPGWFKEFLANIFFFSNINHQQLGLQSSRRCFNAPSMLNDVMQVEIMCGKILPRPGIDHFTSKGVVFKDGTSVDVDVVIFATGYKRKNRYIDSAILQDDIHSQELYKDVFPPRLEHPTCACIGSTDLFGPHGPCFELQTRWAVKVFKGQCTLPPIEKMMDEIQETRENNRKKFGKDKRFVSFVSYEYDLADKIGVRPRLASLLFRDPFLGFRVFFGPALPSIYRLNGPHSWNGARNAIMGYRNASSKSTRIPKPNTKSFNRLYHRLALLIIRR
ncbi:Dimethylaniline monooxygenase [N-oxide-forming] 3 [Holothuria leucospilota]|uniref:Flavin-containing monooxygenase n=1 Tax=Holothuria leucospilota TaxID=206669 RepID=A0A9Q0YTE6_HOLLE|nr:Dimethylaniline monooxygenase [N-oxide-forming] 3 [Holothuria leucospilota]